MYTACSSPWVSVSLSPIRRPFLIRKNYLFVRQGNKYLLSIKIVHYDDQLSISWSAVNISWSAVKVFRDFVVHQIFNPCFMVGEV
jgi:hypothetical protein